MKTFIKRFAYLLFIIVNNHLLLGQSIQPGCTSGNFGIDADINSNRLQFISGTASGTDDWIKSATFPGTGISVIDTTGARAIYNRIINTPSSINNVFQRQMPYAYYENVGGNSQLDAIFYRDYTGGTFGSNNYYDSTAFTSASKNGANPVVWAAGPAGVGGKTEIIDVYGHIRRLGTTINGQMWLYCGASILDPNGARYLDFEFLQRKLQFNGTNFYNVGPDEGHTAYLFDASGNISQAGDVIFSVSASQNGEPALELRIWVAKSTYNAWRTMPPAQLPFKFSGLFDGASNSSTYGYASIIQKTGTFFDACGKANTTGTTASPAWGTIDQNSNYGLIYNANQFIELGFNLSSVGLDPLSIAGGSNPCGAAFQSFFVKTRQSAAFTSNLSDFAGPLDFGGSPNYTVSITANVPFSCDNSPVLLTANVMPKPIGNLYYYTWTLPNGSKRFGTRLDTITVTQNGNYTVEVAPINGCQPNASFTYSLLSDFQPAITSAFSTSTPLCYGRGTRATIVSGIGSNLCTDTYQWRYDGGAWNTYVSGTTVGQLANDSVEIRITRNCSIQCASRVTILKWRVALPQIVGATGSLLTCVNAAGYMGTLSATNPSPSTGIWSVISGPGTVVTPTSLNTSIGGLSKTGQTTRLGWVVTNSYGCKDTAIVSFTPPSIDSAMISKYSTEYCLTCPIMDGNMLSYYDLNGKLLSRVTDIADSASIGSTVFCGQLPYNVSGNPAVSDVRTVTSYIDGVGVVPQPYLPRAWNVNTTNDAPMTINLYFTDQEVAALQGKTLDSGSYYYFDYAPELLLVAYPNNSNTFIPAGSPNGIVYHPTFTRVNGYWEVTFSIPQSATFYLYPSHWLSTALPVELIDLKALALTDAIEVDWSTVSELNNLKFEIEKSTNSKSFVKIGEVAGSGNSNSLIRYKFTDNNVVAGVEYFYRIKQIDYDGKNNTTDFVSAIIKNTESLDIDLFMPNPTHNFSFIKVNCSKPEVFNFSVFDANGNMVLENNYDLEKGRTLVRLDFSSLSNGLYLVFITSESGSEVRKLVVKK